MSNSIAMPINNAARRARTAIRRLLSSFRRRVANRQRSACHSLFVVDSQPIHAYIVLDASPGKLQGLLTEIASEPTDSRDHIPVIFTDSREFSAIAETGIAFEYLPDRQTWQHHRQDWPWTAFIHERLAELSRCYRPRKTVVVSSPTELRLT